MKPDDLVHDVAMGLVWIGVLWLVVGIAAVAFRIWLTERRWR